MNGFLPPFANRLAQLFDRQFRAAGFRRRLMTVVTLGVVGLALLLSLTSSWLGSERLRDNVMLQGLRVAETVAGQSKLALLYGSPENVTTLVAVTLDFPDVAGVEIRDLTGKAVVDTVSADPSHNVDPTSASLFAKLRGGHGFLDSETPSAWSFVAPVMQAASDSPFTEGKKAELLGYVRIVQSKDRLLAARRGIFTANLVISALFTFGALVIVRILASSLMRPLKRLGDSMTRVEAGATEIRAELAGPPDIAKMARTFNGMMDALEERQQLLRTVNSALEADIQARLKAEEEVRDLNTQLENRVIQRTAELEVANKELSAFSYSVSHDLRAPLRRIQGFAQVIVDEFSSGFDERATHFLDRICAGASEMSTMIDSFLRLSRLSRGEMRIEPIDLSQLAEEIVAVLRESSEHKVTVFIEKHLIVQGDHALLKLAMENLLANAWKFTRTTKDAHITVTASLEPDRRVYKIEDNGAGFDMAVASRLFTPFGRLHRADEFEGTGIGLATVQRVIARHSGRVWAEGRPGAGAIFSFTLWEGKA
jgi:signal transduction histidine kinase